ncbi:MAG TPA: YbaN family protein [Burkholderiaceae bacterium]|nr:YbaN family protein [Burkholderiaceae bacterium]
MIRQLHTPLEQGLPVHQTHMKITLNIIGTIAVILAILGVFLPLLPTTPFLLLASACYVRGSTRMHRWLLANPLFGEYLRNIEEKRGIPLRAKIIALILLWASILYSVQTVQWMALKIMLLALASGVSIYLLRMKTLQETPDRDQTEGNS